MSNVVITGSNRGLGFELLVEFAKNKHNIIACSRLRTKNFELQCKKIEIECGVKIYTIYFDLSDKDQILKGIEQIKALNIDIDVLINNAAICVIKPQLFTEYEEVENSFRVNFFAPFLITKMLSELMIRQNKGSIVNITSIGSLGHQPGGASYDTSKAALNQFTISIAQELAPFNVRVNAVACGVMQTEMFTGMREDVKKRLIKTIAFKRPANLDEISRVVMFLTLKDSSYITGQIIRVDGGAIV